LKIDKKKKKKKNTNKSIRKIQCPAVQISILRYDSYLSQTIIHGLHLEARGAAGGVV